MCAAEDLRRPSPSLTLHEARNCRRAPRVSICRKGASETGSDSSCVCNVSSGAADDPYVHLALGLALAKKAQQNGIVEMLPAARQHFVAMLNLNSDLAEADLARKNIASIDAYLKSR